VTDEIAGIIPILATPFNSEGEVDVQGFAAIVESAIEDGAHAVAMFGLASEYYKLTDDERRILTSILIKTTRDRVPVIISITHHSTEVAVRQAIEARGASLLYLPPYSPDLNPIEQAFAKLKALLRTEAARTIDALWSAVGRLLDQFTSAECANYLVHAGYRESG